MISAHYWQRCSIYITKGDESGKSWQEKNPRSTVRTNNRFWERTANEPLDPKQWEYDRTCNEKNKHRKQKSPCGSSGWMSLVCFPFKVVVGHYLFCWFNLVRFDRAGKIQNQDWHLVQSQVRIVIWNILSNNMCLHLWKELVTTGLK